MDERATNPKRTSSYETKTENTHINNHWNILWNMHWKLLLKCANGSMWSAFDDLSIHFQCYFFFSFRFCLCFHSISSFFVSFTNKIYFFSQIEFTMWWIYFWLIFQFIFKPLHIIRSTPSTTNSFSIFCVIFLSGISWNGYFFSFYLCVHLHALQYLLILLSMQT